MLPPLMPSWGAFREGHRRLRHQVGLLLPSATQNPGASCTNGSAQPRSHAHDRPTLSHMCPMPRGAHLSGNASEVKRHGQPGSSLEKECTHLNGEEDAIWSCNVHPRDWGTLRCKGEFEGACNQPGKCTIGTKAHDCKQRGSTPEKPAYPRGQAPSAGTIAGLPLGRRHDTPSIPAETK